jgi:phage terminase large subunit-like protein
MLPRQNGKNAVIEMRELFGMVFLGEHILHTAHEVKTSRKAFLRLCGFFENEREYPELAKLVATVRRTNGQEAILLTNGGSVEFVARSRGSARGFTVDVVVCDEAQELTDEQLEALMPTMSSAPTGNPQLIMTGTPPNHNASGEVLKRVRQRACEKRRGGRLSWYEWSVDEIGDVTDRSRWEAVNPALGIRLNVSVIEDELAQMSEDGFARERLGWWAESSAMVLVGKTAWDSLATKKPPSKGKLAYGIKFSPDGATVSLAVALKPTEGKPHVEVIEHRSLSHGTAWLVEWLSKRRGTAAVMVIDGMSGASALIEALVAEKMPLKALCAPKARDVISAASMMLTAITEKSITHYNQPTLNESVLNAQRRLIGTSGGWGWGGIGDVDVSPIEAVSLAYWGVMTTKRNPARKLRLL